MGLGPDMQRMMPLDPHQYGLLAAALQGDPQATDAVVDHWLPVVLGWCARLGGPGVDPEDAAADVFLVVVRRFHQVRAPEAFPTWLMAVTRRTLANHRRRAWWRRWLPGAAWDREDPSTRPDAGDLRRHVQGLLERLPRAQREVVVLCDGEDRSMPEAAQILGIPLGTAASRLRAARARLRALEADPQDAPAPVAWRERP